MAGVRCFVALELPDSVAGALVRAGDALRDVDPSWRSEKWVARENLHVTLKFFGSLDPADVERVADALAIAAARAHAIELAPKGIRAVPGVGRASMVWGSFNDSQGRAAELAAAVDRVAVGFGVEPETRPFVPHVTLVRSRRPRRLGAEALHAAELAFSASETPVSLRRVTFIASTLTKKGPVYEAMGSWELGT